MTIYFSANLLYIFNDKRHGPLRLILTLNIIIKFPAKLFMMIFMPP